MSALQDIYDLQHISKVTKKDHIALVGEATNVMAQFWSRATEGGG
jgi:hypothetical protein